MPPPCAPDELPDTTQLVSTSAPKLTIPPPGLSVLPFRRTRLLSLTGTSESVRRIRNSGPEGARRMTILELGPVMVSPFRITSEPPPLAGDASVIGPVRPA